MTCRDYIRFRPMAASILIMVMTLIGGGSTFWVASWWRDMHPIMVSIDSATVSPDGNFLVVVGHSDPPKKCLRQTVHLIYWDAADGTRTYLTLATAMNGMGLGGLVERYRLLLPIPPGLKGDWYYISRSAYQCQPGGLIRGTWTTQPPVKISLGERHG